MKIFHEMYGNYFRIVSEILRQKEITKEQINKIVSEHGFKETNFFLPDKILSRNGDGWQLLEKEDGILKRILKHEPVSLLTEIQKRWLKSKLDDPKINLFMRKDVISALKKRLESVKPLYRNEYFRYTDRFIDGDDFSDINYQENFRIVLNAVKNHEILEISFNSNTGKKITGYYVPVKIQYSPKNNRFRLFTFVFKENAISGNGIINIGRITEIRKTGELWKKGISVEEYFLQRKCNEPVTVCVSKERNATERFFMEFAPYKKSTELDLSSGNCVVKIWYDYQGETELLIRLLGFGSVIEIISPPEFRQKAKERIDRQYTFLNENR